MGAHFWGAGGGQNVIFFSSNHGSAQCDHFVKNWSRSVVVSLGSFRWPIFGGCIDYIEPKCDNLYG